MISTKTSEEFLPLSISENLVIQELKGEILIYNTETNHAHCLNSTAALVWQACDGGRSVTEIGRLVCVDEDLGKNLVWLALEQLQKEGLIARHDELKNRFDRLSRRDVIKKIGLASMIAIPVISTMTAPASMYAASGGMCVNPALTSCTVDMDCVGSPSGDTCNNFCCVIGPPIMGGGGCPPGQIFC